MGRVMSRRERKIWYYALTALGTVASSYYFNYLFFLLHDRFGFGDRQNLWVSALHGAIYIVAAVQCGRFAERRGYHLSLLVGFGGLFLCMLAGAWVETAEGTVVVLALYSVVLLFIWPAMEALVVEHEPADRVPHMVGIYNCTWSGSAAVAYFTGGPLYEWLGAGAVFGVPALIFLVEFGVVLWLGRFAAADVSLRHPAPSASVARRPDEGSARQASPDTFLRLAWIANPLSYVAVYTLFAVMPGLAERFSLSPTDVGLFCSVWLFGRLAAFAGLWGWTGWHYRFGWLAGGYAVLCVSFAGILLSPTLWGMVVAQVAFGGATGLIYYSSLFYSMDAGDAKAEHGGFHESMIGVGIFAGPAVGAASLQFFPEVSYAGVVAVSGVLASGFGVLMAVWAKARLVAAGRVF